MTGPRRDWNQRNPTHMFPALRSALAPVGVVLDTTDRNFVTGSTLRTRAFVVNDSPEAVTRELTLHLETANPAWQTEALRTEPVIRHTVTVAPFARAELPFELTLPDVETTLTLVARIDDVLSQRPLRTLPPPDAAGRAIAAGQIRNWVRRGGRLLLLRQPVWNDTNSWTALAFADRIGYLTWTSEADHGSTLWIDPSHNLPLDWNKAWGDGWNGHEGMITDLALAAPWLPGNAPALQNRAGWIPALEGSLLLPVSSLQHNWPADHPENRFFVDGTQRSLSYLRTGTPTLLCTRQPPPEGGFQASLRFTSPAMAATLKVFEHGRRGSSPFRWRINAGPWREIGGDAPSAGMKRVSSEANVWFGWTTIGDVELEAGEHLLELAVDQPNRDGTLLLALDDFLLVPQVPIRVLAHSGGRRPAIVELPADKGTLVLCQTLFGQRLDPAAAEFDPAAARLFLSLLAPRPQSDTPQHD